MSNGIDIEYKVGLDSATPQMDRLRKFARQPAVLNVIALDCADLTKNHILALGTNKMGWPSTGFYKEIARNGIATEINAGGFDVGASFTIKIDHPDKPGAFRQRYWGGVINMKERLLTIPARQEFYGRNAREFSNLKFAMNPRTGAKWLYIGTGGTKESRNYGFANDWHRRKGLGAREAMMVAYWLKESVKQDPDPNVIPDMETYQSQITYSLTKAFFKYVKAMGSL